MYSSDIPRLEHQVLRGDLEVVLLDNTLEPVNPVVYHVVIRQLDPVEPCMNALHSLFTHFVRCDPPRPNE